MVEAKHGSRSSRGFRWLLGTTLLAACAGSAPTVRPSVVRVRPGIEVLLADSMPLVAGRRVGLVTNLAAVDRAGRSIIERLRGGGVTIGAFFAPEHGLAATAAPGEKIASVRPGHSSMSWPNSAPTRNLKASKPWRSRNSRKRFASFSGVMSRFIEEA